MDRHKQEAWARLKRDMGVGWLIAFGLLLVIISIGVIVGASRLWLPLLAIHLAMTVALWATYFVKSRAVFEVLTWVCAAAVFTTIAAILVSGA